MVEFETININELKPAEYNPRYMPEEEMSKLRNNLETFGLVDPIIIDLTDDNTVIGGHQRLEVLKEIDDTQDLKLLRLGDVGLIFRETDLKIKDKNDQKALNLSLNKINGEWDYSKLDDLLLELNEDNYQIELTGFTDDEIGGELLDLDSIFPDGNELPSDEGIITEEEEPVKEEAPYTPLKEVKVIVREGDKWKLGNHTLFCADSEDINNIKELIGDEKIDLILTDPPYGINIVNTTIGGAKPATFTEKKN